MRKSKLCLITGEYFLLNMKVFQPAMLVLPEGGQKYMV